MMLKDDTYKLLSEERTIIPQVRLALRGKSSSGKQAKQKYRQSEKGKQAYKQSNRRWKQSEHGKRKVRQYLEDNDMNERNRKKTRENRTQVSREMAEMMRAARDEYADDGSLHANKLLFPIIGTQDAINDKGATVLDYCTPTPDNPNRLNDSDTLTVGIWMW